MTQRYSFCLIQRPAISLSMRTLLPMAYCLLYSLHQNIALWFSTCKRHSFRPTLPELPVSAVIVAYMHVMAYPLAEHMQALCQDTYAIVLQMICCCCTEGKFCISPVKEETSTDVAWAICSVFSILTAARARHKSQQCLASSDICLAGSVGRRITRNTTAESWSSSHRQSTLYQ